MASAVAMQVSGALAQATLPPVIVQVNGHAVPVVQGIAWVLPGDVVMAPSGWMQLNPQPNVPGDPVRMRPSKAHAAAGIAAKMPTLPDGTSLTAAALPLPKHLGIGLPTDATYEQDYAVPLQWVAYLAAHGWHINAPVRI